MWILSDEDREQSRKKKTVNRQTSGEEREGTFTNHTKGRRDNIKNVWREELRVQINTNMVLPFKQRCFPPQHFVSKDTSWNLAVAFSGLWSIADTVLAHAAAAAEECGSDHSMAVQHWKRVVHPHRDTTGRAGYLSIHLLIIKKEGWQNVETHKGLK